MTMKVEYEGRSVDDAIQKACTSLNVSRDNLDIEVLSTGSAGIFGICKRSAKILVSKKKADEIADISIDSRSIFKKGTKRRRENRSERTEQIEDVSPEALKTVEADLAKLLELMDYSFDVKLEANSNKINAHLNGEDIDGFVGNEGQTLDSLQFIMRKIISKKFPERIQFSLDAGDFRETRMAELSEQALKLAEEVKQTGKTASISAMNPAERRIVHMTLQNDTTIRSRSVGDGLYKKILIYLPGKNRKKPSQKRKQNGRKGQRKNFS